MLNIKLFPDAEFASAYEIPYEELYKRGYRGIIFDIDNTLVMHGAPADDKAIALFKRLHAIGFKTLLLSNNKEPRVKSFNDLVHSDYIFKAGKPAKKGYELALQIMGTEANNTLSIGDQIFTDIWGAKNVGIFSIMTKKIHPKEEIQIVFKRLLEAIILPVYHLSLRPGKKYSFGLIGHPVNHSQSGALHADNAQKAGIKATYELLDCLDENDIKSVLEKNYDGLNVTVPYKETIMKYIKEIDYEAFKIGAVNTLVKTRSGYKGYNTDVYGLMRSFGNSGINIRGEHIVILGAGGAARAALALCIQSGAAYVTVLNRNPEKAGRLISELNANYNNQSTVCEYHSYEEFFSNLPDNQFIAINATPVGMYPNVDDCLTDNDKFYEKVKSGFDFIYTPEETLFLKRIREKGGKTVNGYEMLVYQARKAFELWTGKLLI